MSKITKKSYIATVGRRKTAVARVRLMKTGTGKIIVNEKDFKQYFTAELSTLLMAPLKVAGLEDKVDISVKITGGGKNSQAESVRLGIAKALVELNPDYKPSLKKKGYLRRDARKKERKKPGLKRARRAPQWSKR